MQAGVHPKVVSERLGHATVSITLDAYSHAIPAMQGEEEAFIAGLVFAGEPAGASLRCRRRPSACLLGDPSCSCQMRLLNPTRSADGFPARLWEGAACQAALIGAPPPPGSEMAMGPTEEVDRYIG